jgi:hypothetical protein
MKIARLSLQVRTTSKKIESTLTIFLSLLLDQEHLELKAQTKKAPFSKKKVSSILKEMRTFLCHLRINTTKRLLKNLRMVVSLSNS